MGQGGMMKVPVADKNIKIMPLLCNIIIKTHSQP